MTRNYVFDANVNAVYVGDAFMVEVSKLTGKAFDKYEGSRLCPVSIIAVDPNAKGMPTLTLSSPFGEFTRIACWFKPQRKLHQVN